MDNYMEHNQVKYEPHLVFRFQISYHTFATLPRGFVILSDEHSETLLHLDRSVVPRRVRVIQGMALKAMGKSVDMSSDLKPGWLRLVDD